MISTKTYIPAKPRSKKLVGTSIGGISGGTGTGGVLTVEQSQILIDAVKTKDDLENLRIGSVNLLRNTGFLGDFRSLDVDALTAVIAETPVATNEFAYWLQEGCSVIDAPSKSGKGARIGHLQQNTPILQIGETYTLTFWARGTTLTASIVEETVIPLTTEYKQYEMRIVIPETKVYIFTLSDATGTAEVYNIQLERGNRATDYNYSPEDDLKAISQLQAINVITSAIKEGNTEILGGLILTTMIQLGKYKDGVIEKVNAGISGIWNSDDDPAMWAGGSFEQAIRTVQKIKSNPGYNPTDEEWADMAKIVMTHGGDGIFRGIVYALGGIFRGRVVSGSGDTEIIIDPDTSTVRYKSDGVIVGETFFVGNRWVQTRYFGYWNNGNLRSKVIMDNLNGFVLETYLEDGITVDKFTEHFIDGSIFNGNLLDLTDEEADATLTSGYWYRTGRTIKVKP